MSCTTIILALRPDVDALALEEALRVWGLSLVDKVHISGYKIECWFLISESQLRMDFTREPYPGEYCFLPLQEITRSITKRLSSLT